MGETMTLTAKDGHRLAAYLARPEGRPRGGLVVIQEIFGVNAHMRGLADGFARDGYLAIVPALFDRIRPGIELGYGPDDVAKGRDLKANAVDAGALLDVEAALDVAKAAGKVAMVGYCWGGYLAWIAATRIAGFAAAASYYGGGIGAVAAEHPKCPVVLHFGEQDHAIPLAEVERVRRAHPEIPVHLYPAGHGFNCEQRGSFEPKSAEIARERTLELFRQHVG